MSGDVGEIYETWLTQVIRCLAHTEAMIDFGDDEEDVTDDSYVQAIQRVQELADSIRKHLADGRKGEILRSGMQVAILGPPNAGKSSLLNILARRPAAIVSSIAGTTRDIVQVPLNISGYPVLVSDTAGIRETEDLIEKEGVVRAQQCAEEADIRIVMMDIQDAEARLLKEYGEYLTRDTLVVLNKSDQMEGNEIQAAIAALQSPEASNVKVISCTNGEGIDALVDSLSGFVRQK